MTREDFEEFIHNKIDDALERLPVGDRGQEKWVKALCESLIEIVREDAEEAPDDSEEEDSDPEDDEDEE